jgi:hypothetical protein
MTKRWTWEEQLLLKKHYGTMPIEHLIEDYLPLRNEAAIYAKVHNLRKRGWTFPDKTRR